MNKLKFILLLCLLPYLISGQKVSKKRYYGNYTMQLYLIDQNMPVTGVLIDTRDSSLLMVKEQECRYLKQGNFQISEFKVMEIEKIKVKNSSAALYLSVSGIVVYKFSNNGN